MQYLFKHTLVKIFLLLLPLLICFSSKALPYTVITNSNSEYISITNERLKDIYIGDKTFWKSGERIRAARLSDEDPITAEFLELSFL